MHILFVDESGTPPVLGKSDPRYFVVGGVIVPENTWHRLRDGMLGLKLRLKIRGELKWRYFAGTNDQQENPMRKFDQATRDTIRAEIYRLICSERSVKSIAAVCSIGAVYEISSVTTPDDIYKLAYKALTERLQYYLQDLSREVGRKEFGIVVADHRGKQDDKRLRAHHQMLLYSSAEFVSRYDNLIESLFLQPSNLSIGIQFADLVAGAVWRKFERGDDRWYKQMEPSLRRSRKGDIEGYGIVKVPKAGWR
jgi:hypothetical protein